jgi:hypothetical protein
MSGTMFHERRLVLRVLTCWETLRAEQEWPARGDLDPAAFGDDWGHCFILGLEPAGEPSLLYVGEALAAQAGGPVGGRLDSYPDGALVRIFGSFYPRVLARRIPMSNGGTAFDRGRDILFRSILLPLSEDGVAIDGLLGAGNWGEKVAVAQPETAEAG